MLVFLLTAWFLQSSNESDDGKHHILKSSCLRFCGHIRLRIDYLWTIENLDFFSDRSCLMFTNTIKISREKLFIYPPVRLYQFKCLNGCEITKVFLYKYMGYELIRTYCNKYIFDPIKEIVMLQFSKNCNHTSAAFTNCIRV